jgi:hypothetical protein
MMKSGLSSPSFSITLIAVGGNDSCSTMTGGSSSSSSTQQVKAFYLGFRNISSLSVLAPERLVVISLSV